MATRKTVGTGRARGSKRPKSKAGGKLALFGGSKAVAGGVGPWPAVDAAAIRAVTEALRNESLSPLIEGLPKQFEQQFARYHGRKYALMVNSGTAALHLALVGCDIRPGDEVITTPYTWGATTGCILHHNAIPVFADIDPETLCLDPTKIEERITSRTRAILPAHIFGMPAYMAAIMKIARKHGLAVVEDASQAAGARYRGKLAGALGHVGAFSLQASKNLTAGEGGILITNEFATYERALLFGAHPVRMNAEVRKADLRAYIDSLGFTYRPHPLGAAIARAQLPHLAAWTRDKNRNFTRLFRKIKGIAEPHGADFFRRHPKCLHGYHMVSFKIVHPDLEQVPPPLVVEALRREGMSVGGYVGTPIPLRPRFRDLLFYGRGCPWTCRHTHRLPDYTPGSWPVAEALCRRGEIILFGNHYKPDPTLMGQYAIAFQKLADNAERLLERAEKSATRRR